MKNYNIKSLDDLLAKKQDLKLEYTFKEEALKTDFKVYIKQFTLGSLIKKYASPSNLLRVDDKLNISGTLMSMVLPLFMNKTLFRGSSFITKALVGYASGKLGKTLDADHLSAIFNSVKGWFSKSKNRKKTEKFIDYGIPPDSETF